LASVASKDKAKWIFRALHENFTATLAFTDPTAGPYFRLQRK